MNTPPVPPVSLEFRVNAEAAVHNLFRACERVVMPGWDGTTHARSLATLRSARERVIEAMPKPGTDDDVVAWLDRWTVVLGHVAMAYMNGHPADAYQVCDNCSGTVTPRGEVSIDAGTASAMVDTACAGTCQRQGVHYWTASDSEYRMAFGHSFGETDPVKTGEITTAEVWCEALNEERVDHGWSLCDQVAHAQADMVAAGVPLTGVMAKTGEGVAWPEALLTTNLWVAGWRRDTQRWEPLRQGPADHAVAEQEDRK